MPRRRCAWHAVRLPSGGGTGADRSVPRRGGRVGARSGRRPGSRGADRSSPDRSSAGRGPRPPRTGPCPSRDGRRTPPNSRAGRHWSLLGGGGAAGGIRRSRPVTRSGRGCPAPVETSDRVPVRIGHPGSDGCRRGNRRSAHGCSGFRARKVAIDLLTSPAGSCNSRAVRTNPASPSNEASRSGGCRWIVGDGMASIGLCRTQTHVVSHVPGHHQVAAGCERAMELGEHDGHSSGGV